MTFQHVTCKKFIRSIYLLSLVQILKTLTEPRSEKVSITEFPMVRKSLLPRKRMVLPSAGAKQIPAFCAHFTPPCNPLCVPGRQSLPPASWPARLTHMESTMDSLAFWLQVQLTGKHGQDFGGQGESEARAFILRTASLLSGCGMIMSLRGRP